MGGRVPVDLKRVGILRGQDLHSRVALQRPLQIIELIVDPRDNGCISQTRTDIPRDIQW